MKDILLLLFCVVTGAVSLSAQTFNDGSLTYSVTSSSPAEVAVTGRVSTSVTAINIPAMVESGGVVYDVVSVAAGAFSGHTNITKVFIGKNVRTIASSAFLGGGKVDRYYSNLTDLQFADDSRLSYIGANAFALNDLSAVAVSIPGTVKTIDTGAFHYCGMSKVVLGEGVEVIGNGAFFDEDYMEEIVIPSTVKELKPFAFMWCGSLKSISLPGVTKIGDFAFAYSSRIQTMTLCENLESLGECAFVGCRSVQSVDIGANNALLTKEDNVLYSKDKTRLVFFIPQQDLSGVKYQYKVPHFVKEIGGGAFCSRQILSLVLPSGLERIGRLAFHGSVYDRITIPANAVLAAGSLCGRFKELYLMGNQGPDQVLAAMTFETLSPTGSISSSASTYAYFFGYPQVDVYCKESMYADNYSKLAGKSLYSNYNIKSVNYKIPHTSTLGNTLTTMCRDFDIDLDVDADWTDGIKAYVASTAVVGEAFTSWDGTEYDSRGTRVEMKEVKYIPSRTGANNDEYTGVLLRGEKGKQLYFKMGERDCYSASQEELSGANLLQGAPCYTLVDPTEEDGGSTYVNYGLNNGKFKEYSQAGVVPWNRAFLRLPESSALAREVDFVFADSGTDGIIVSESEGGRESSRGRLYMLDGRAVADGVQPSQKGVYVRNGRKFIVK